MSYYWVHGVYVRVSKYARYSGYNRLYSLSKGLLLKKMIYSQKEFLLYKYAASNYVKEMFFL